jgi:hypothetical protein
MQRELSYSIRNFIPESKRTASTKHQLTITVLTTTLTSPLCAIVKSPNLSAMRSIYFSLPLSARTAGYIINKRKCIVKILNMYGILYVSQHYREHEKVKKKHSKRRYFSFANKNKIYYTI